MELNFILNENTGSWVAEFDATADFNLHIEGVAEGNIRVYQSGVKGAEPAFVRGSTPYPSLSKVYDMDFSAIVYPKYIKVVCADQPTMGVVTFNA